MLAPERKKAAAHALPNERTCITLPDGRVLGFAEYGDPHGAPVFGFHGTPGSRFMFRLADQEAKRLGLRILAPDRPGFGLSTFQKDRSLRDWAADMAALSSHLGLRRFGVAGISGGGPYAVAAAALLPDRVSTAALVSPLGPIRFPEAPKEIEAAPYLTFRVMPAMQPALRGIFTVGRAMFLHAQPIMYGLLMSRVGARDRQILSRPEVRRNLLDGLAEGLRPGSRGAVEELKIFSRPWDIPFDAIKARVYLWQGTADRNVPVEASFHLGKAIPNAQVFQLQGEGHYWIFGHMTEVLTTIRSAMIES